MACGWDWVSGGGLPGYWRIRQIKRGAKPHDGKGFGGNRLSRYPNIEICGLIIQPFSRDCFINQIRLR